MLLSEKLQGWQGGACDVNALLAEAGDREVSGKRVKLPFRDGHLALNFFGRESHGYYYPRGGEPIHVIRLFPPQGN